MSGQEVRSWEESLYLQRPLSFPLSLPVPLPHCGLSSEHMCMPHHDVQNKILNKNRPESRRKSGRSVISEVLWFISSFHLRDFNSNREWLIRYEVCHNLLQCRPDWGHCVCEWCTQRGFVVSLDKLLRHCAALRLFCAGCWKGEACGEMETLMVCGDYGHAGMMSCTGCVHVHSNPWQHTF